MKKWVTAFFMAWGKFWAIPCPCRVWDSALTALSLVWLPFFGLMLGALWAAAAYLLELAGCPPALKAALLTVIPYIITGFIHLDGFMDCSDAILSRRDLPERQRILKDPATGSFAVISLCIVMIVSFAALSGGIGGKNLICLAVIPAVSRCCSSLAVITRRPIGHSSYAGLFSSRKARRRHSAAVIFMLAAAVAAPAALIFPLGLCAAATAAGSFCALEYGIRQLGGMSGDVSGYAITAGEMCGIVAFVLL